MNATAFRSFAHAPWFHTQHSSHTYTYTYTYTYMHHTNAHNDVGGGDSHPHRARKHCHDSSPAHARVDGFHSPRRPANSLDFGCTSALPASRGFLLPAAAPADADDDAGRLTPFFLLAGAFVFLPSPEATAAGLRSGVCRPETTVIAQFTRTVTALDTGLKLNLNSNGSHSMLCMPATVR
jgi:hypothetical protein